MANNVKQEQYLSPFVIYILLLYIVPQLIIIYLTFAISEIDLKKEMENKLNIIADHKAASIDGYIADTQNKAKILAYNPIIVEALIKMNAFENSPEKSREIEIIADSISAYVAYFLALNKYDKIYFISSQNQILFSLGKDDNYKVDQSQQISSLPELSKAAERAKVLMDTEITNFTAAQDSKAQVAFIAVPVISKGIIRGVIALQLSNQEIHRIISSSIGTSASLETVVGAVQPDSDIRLMLPPKSDQSKTVLKSSDPKDKETYYYLDNAARGGGGQKSVIFNDYHGQNAISVARYLPSLRWGMLTKIDTGEAFSGIEQLRKNILWLVGITLPLLSLILYRVSGKLESAKEFLNNIINSMPSPMIILDEKRKITLWNQEAEKQSGTTLEEVKGKPVNTVFNYLESENAKISLALSLNEPQKIEKISRQTAEGTSYFELLIYPLKGRKFHGIALLIQDITHRIQLMDSLQRQERLASIGMLVAGIAHEINNPINFVTANVNSLRNDVNDVLKVLKEYSQITINSANNLEEFKNMIGKINSFKEEIDLDYTVEEIEKLLAGVDEGAQRTAIIVKGLKTFSRLDDTEMMNIDILHGIESTLTLLSNKYKDRIEIVKKYDVIPTIDCYPGKLNQMFMNILSNAIYAIKGEGKIYITVSKGLNSITISIRDTGEGIKEENKSKIFMPFFTTKDVGEGTGLGLSITYNIVLDHHGTITFNSEEGKGTEFIITLPIKQP